MKYINVIMLFVGLIVNIALYLCSSPNVGIGISENGDISAVGSINELGEKDGYWFYLDTCNSRQITTIVGYYKDNKADSLWVHFYRSAYPGVYASYCMSNDSARGFRYIYNTKGHLDRMYYVWPNQVKNEWDYYDDEKIDSNFWAPWEPMCGDEGQWLFAELKIQEFDSRYESIIIFDIILLSLLLIINIVFGIVCRERRI